MSLRRGLQLLCVSSVVCLLSPAEAGRMRFLNADKHTQAPYSFTPSPNVAPTPPAPTTNAPVVVPFMVTSAPYVIGSPAPTFLSLPPTQVPIPNPAPTPPVSAYTAPTNYVSPTQCPGQYECAAAGGVSAFNDTVVAPQCYPYGTYVNTAGNPVQFSPECVPYGNNGTAMQCPVQYDAPQSHGAGVQDFVCYVYDPFRAELPWANSTAAYAQCYNPVEYACTATNFLCPLTAPYACGRQCFSASQYRCVVNTQNVFQSELQSVSSTPSSTFICPKQPINPNCPTTAPSM